MTRYFQPLKKPILIMAKTKTISKGCPKCEQQVNLTIFTQSRQCGKDSDGRSLHTYSLFTFLTSIHALFNTIISSLYLLSSYRFNSTKLYKLFFHSSLNSILLFYSYDLLTIKILRINSSLNRFEVIITVIQSSRLLLLLFFYCS